MRRRRAASLKKTPFKKMHTMSIKKIFPLLALWLSTAVSCQVVAQKSTASENKYRVSVDLNQVNDDKVQVSVLVPKLNQPETIYNMPKIVPGTYSISDFGRFVSDFQAFDKNGTPLTVQRLDTNRWKILNASKLHRISYWIDDTFDDKDTDNIIFEPGGTNIEAGNNFLLNPFGVVGYLEGIKQLPYELNIVKPQGFYGSTPLIAKTTTDTQDTYLVPNYVELADSPLMYNRPDTTVLKIGNTDVLVSVYSPTGRVTSKPIATNIRDILEAQRKYLGGTLPVDKYAFLIYVPERVGKSGSYGALEHSYSSVYFLPEMPTGMFSSTIRDVAAHEFFHIVTPLNIHSEEIGNFDFINPKMSRHLWLYEGVTEYFATHVQVHEGLYDLDTYLQKLREYIATSREYYNDTLPFTVMSTEVLEKYEKQYPNVYQKGPLIGFVLDIKLLEQSQGKYGLRNLMQDLSKTYGKDKAFKDAELFDKIAELTYPGIREFFAKYVEGTEPLPLQETFRKVGILYEPQSKETFNSYGGFIPGYDHETNKIIVVETSDMDAFGKQLGLQEGDQLLKFNGKEITPENIRELIADSLQAMKPGETVTITVGRRNNNGKIKEKQLKGTVTSVEREAIHVLKPDPKATAKQKALRAAWLNENV